jgi:hypothetical protein
VNVLFIRKTPTDVRWYLETFPEGALLETSTEGYTSWKTAKVAALAAHPEAERVFVNAVRGFGVEFEDSL